MRTLEEANEVTAVRLIQKRRFAKVGDLFRLSPCDGIFLWGRLIKKAKFFGNDFEMNLVYIYDAISGEEPKTEVLSPSNLIIGPSVVNDLGWVRGYWEIMASQPLRPSDVREKHVFIRSWGTGSPTDHDLVDEDGRVVVDPKVDPRSLSESGYSNFDHIDRLVRGILEERGLIA
jgi:hypothetical protein